MEQNIKEPSIKMCCFNLLNFQIWLKFHHHFMDNVEMDIEEIRLEGVDWNHMAQNMYRCQAFVDTVVNLWVP
jgi:hypothetical protein